jgi:hypothetical protein
VNVLYGSTPWGLDDHGNELWWEGLYGMVGTTAANDLFGYALAAGDFNGDGRDDLAVGVPGQDIGGILSAGQVIVLYGIHSGLSSTSSQEWAQGVSGLGGEPEAYDQFGESLTAGDFNGDGRDDLAVGAPDEDWGTTEDVGAVSVLYGSRDGLTAAGNQVWFDTSYEENDEYGRALAAGDFNGDGRDDLAVGIPGQLVGGDASAGAAEILYGASSGLFRRTGIWNDVWHQDRGGMVDSAELHDRFGTSLAAGNFNGDDYADLAVGIPREDIGSAHQAGAIHIMHGSAGGIAIAGNAFWHQDSPYIEGGCETDDRFGSALAAIPSPRYQKIYLPLVLRNHTR